MTSNATEKTGRNDPCPCGSGKKYKQCCQQQAATVQKQSSPEELAIPKTLAMALAHHQNGELTQADALYQRILEIAPNHPDALHLSAVIAHQNGQHERALVMLDKAIKIRASGPMYCNRGLTLEACGQLDEAVDSYRHALALEPGYAEAHNNLGNALQKQGKQEDALKRYQRAIALKPDYADAHYNLAYLFQQQNQLAAAAESYRCALVFNPGYAAAHNNLGNVLMAQGDIAAAFDCYQEALVLNPNDAETHRNMGKCLSALGKFDSALACYQKALAIEPECADTYFNMALVLQTQGRVDIAVPHYQKAISIEPHEADFHRNMGNALRLCGQLDAASKSIRAAIAIKPNFAEAFSNLGNVQQAQGDLDDALVSHRHALLLKPDFTDAHCNLIFAMDLAANLNTAALQLERKRWDDMHAAPLAALQQPHSNSPDPERRLRIGYVSADFRVHSAADIFSPMLFGFDPAQFDVFAYSNTKNEDAYTQKFVDNVTYWRNIVSLSDDAVADLIRQDEIDILVDLSGHSGGNRLLVFARKPAPLQVTAWGYATSTGMQAMDVFFADAVLVPPDEKKCYVEQVRYLPSVVCHNPRHPMPEVNAAPVLSKGAITFGSFNRLPKVSKVVFQTWAQILLAVPDSTLVIKACELDGQDSRDRVASYFIEAGVDPERIVFLGGSSWEDHVAAFHQIDIALDPFPHGGGVSTLEGLMMGVPVVTLRSPTIVGRLSASIMTTLGLKDWIAETPEQYVQMAIQKAGEVTALASLRHQLRGMIQASIIGDTKAYVSAVEGEYRSLWREWCMTHCR